MTKEKCKERYGKDIDIQLQKMYEINGFSIRKIAKCFRVSRETIRIMLHLFDIKIRSKSETNRRRILSWMTRQKISKSHIGLNKGEKSPCWKPKIQKICLICKKIYEISSYQKEISKYCCRKCKDKSQEGKLRTKEQKRKSSEAHKKLWQSEKYIKKIMKNRKIKPNKKEIKLLRFLQDNHFPYKFVGDGKIWINGKNPDFINTNHQKKIIEFYGDYWHRDEKVKNGGDGGQERREIFAEYGYATLIIWESELENKDKLLIKIKEL